MEFQCRNSLTTTINLLLIFFLCGFVSISSCSESDGTAFKGVDVENPVVNVIPATIAGYAPSAKGSRDVLLCERVRVSGISRFKLGSYASAYRVTMVPSVVIPEKLHSKIQICFHHNTSLGLCQCEKDDWRSFQKGLWSSVMSPYDDRYLDVKFVGEMSGSVTVTVDEELQGWRYIFLALGFILLLLAPVVSNWVPFYYSSSMAIGVFLVILILLFQGMKLLPTGRKNVLYLTLYGSVLGAGSFLLHHFSMMVNSILLNFGMSQEMQNPVSVFLLVGIVLAGAGLGYWLVRKFVISEDGGVDVGVAQFVKWAMRVIAVTFIFQSTIDTPLAMAAVGSCFASYFLITSWKWHGQQSPSYSGNKNLWARSGQATAKHGRAEFFSRSRKMSPQGNLLNGTRNSFAWPNSPVRGLASPSSGRAAGSQPDFYSTFHKTPNRKKFSKKEWEEFTEESTRQAVAEWASSPEFTDWVINHADRIQLLPDDNSDELAGSGSDSTDENFVEKNGLGLFKWQR